MVPLNSIMICIMPKKEGLLLIANWDSLPWIDMIKNGVHRCDK
jgi:hypothetical protein